MKQQLYDLLSNDSGLATLVGTRIRPVRHFIPIEEMTDDQKAAELPQLLYQISAGTNQGGINFSTTREYTIQFDVFALTAEEVADIQQALLDLLDDYGTEPIQGIFWQSTQDIDVDEGFHAQEIYNAFLTIPH